MLRAKWTAPFTVWSQTFFSFFHQNKGDWMQKYQHSIKHLWNCKPMPLLSKKCFKKIAIYIKKSLLFQCSEFITAIFKLISMYKDLFLFLLWWLLQDKNLLILNDFSEVYRGSLKSMRSSGLEQQVQDNDLPQPLIQGDASAEEKTASLSGSQEEWSFNIPSPETPFPPLFLSSVNSHWVVLLSRDPGKMWQLQQTNSAD